MKDFINFFLIIILAGFAVGIAYMIRTSPDSKNVWGVLYIPLFILMIMLGIKLREDY